MNKLRMYSCKFTSDISVVCNVVNEVMAFFMNHCGLLDDTTVFELKVILNELIINAIKYGNKENFEKNVGVLVGFTKDNSIFIIVEDEGTGYDYCSVIDRETKDNEYIDVCSLAENGRGILIVRNLCDIVKHNKKGNKIIVLKKIR